MGRRRPLRAGIYAVKTAESGERVAGLDAALDGRAAAMQRRRQLSQGKKALSRGAGRTGAAAGAGAPVLTVHRGGAG